MTLAQRVAEIVQGEVARAPVLLGQAVERACQHIDLAHQRDLHDAPFLLVDDVGEIGAIAAEAGVDLVEQSAGSLAATKSPVTIRANS